MIFLKVIYALSSVISENQTEHIQSTATAKRQQKQQHRNQCVRARASERWIWVVGKRQLELVREREKKTKVASSVTKGAHVENSLCLELHSTGIGVLWRCAVRVSFLRIDCAHEGHSPNIAVFYGSKAIYMKLTWFRRVISKGYGSFLV